MRIGIVGAGVAGLTVGRLLKEAGHSITIIDQGRHPGGRLTTRDKGHGKFDHGALKFNAKSDEFKQALDVWLQQGYAQPVQYTGEEAGWFEPVPCARDLAQTMALGLGVKVATEVTSLERDDGRWRIRAGNQSWDGFDSVVLNPPVPQTLRLLPSNHVFASKLKPIEYDATWAMTLVLAARDGFLDVPFTKVDSGDLSMVVMEGLRNGRTDDGPWARVLVHASHSFSNAFLESGEELVKERLIKAFEERFGEVKVLYVSVHRWRYARVKNPLGEEHLWDPDLKLGVVGDMMLGSRIESAYLSGYSLAQEFLKS